MPGIPETLRRIAESGRRNHLFTLRNETALFYIQHYGLSKYFTELITRKNGFPNKPKPDALLYLIDQFDLEPNKLLMVGDRGIDTDSARAAGADGCFYNTNDLPLPDSATFEIETPIELLDRI